jgi:hypothetical protein
MPTHRHRTASALDPARERAPILYSTLTAYLRCSASPRHCFFHTIELQLLPARIVIGDDFLAVTHLTCEDQPRQWRFDVLLDGTFQGTRTIRWIITNAY